MRIMQRRGERGDTIVEVLISMAVVSLILGGAYATTNQSLLSTRAAEEQSTALKIAQGQLEQIKSLVGSDPTQLFSASTLTPFCIDGSQNVVPTSDSACTTTTGQLKYQASGLRTNTNDITLTETWLDIRGRNTDTLQLHYRVYQ